MLSVPLPELPTYKLKALVQVEPAPSTVTVPVEPDLEADVAVRVADAAAVEDAQRAVAVIANKQLLVLVQVEPAPSTVTVPVEPEL